MVIKGFKSFPISNYSYFVLKGNPGGLLLRTGKIWQLTRIIHSYSLLKLPAHERWFRPGATVNLVNWCFCWCFRFHGWPGDGKVLFILLFLPSPCWLLIKNQPFSCLTFCTFLLPGRRGFVAGCIAKAIYRLYNIVVLGCQNDWRLGYLFIYTHWLLAFTANL